MIERLRGSLLFRHAALVFAGIAVANACSYLFYVVIGRTAGVVVYGEVTSLLSALLALGAPASVGQLIVAKIAADLYARDDQAALRRLSDIVTRVTLGAGLLVFCIAYLARDPIAHFFNIEDAMPVLAAAFGLAAFLVTYVQRGVLQGAHLFGEYSASVVIEAIARIALGALFVRVWGAAGALAGAGIGIVLGGLYNVVVFNRRFGRVRAHVRVDRSKIALTISGVGLGQITLIVLAFYDVPLVKHAFDARSAGLYAAAALVGRAVLSAAAFIPTLILPKATARVAAGLSPLPLLVAAVSTAVGLAAITIVFCLVAPAWVVSTIAGHAFADAAPLVLLYAIASSALSIATVVAAYQFGLHRYAFVIPTFVAAGIEVITLSLWHPSLTAVVEVLLAGHLCVLLTSLYRVTAPVTMAEAEAEA